MIFIVIMLELIPFLQINAQLNMGVLAYFVQRVKMEVNYEDPQQNMKKPIIIGVIILGGIILVSILVYFIFINGVWMNSSGDINLSEQPNSSGQVYGNYSLNQSRWCVPGRIMTKEDFPNEGKLSDFNIMRQIMYLGMEVCHVREMITAEEYYFNEAGDQNFKVSIENNRRVITPIEYSPNNPAGGLI